jgi:hypothetical protein
MSFWHKRSAPAIWSVGKPATASRHRHPRRIERGLQAEIVWKAKAAGIFVCPVPNEIPIKGKTPEERAIIARIISAMVAQGIMKHGATDLIIWGDTGRAGCVEIKTEAGIDLLGVRTPAGRLNANQKLFRDEARAHGIPWAVVRNWDEFVAFYKTLCV